MLSIRYSDPLDTEREAKDRKNNNGPALKNNFDITNYVQKFVWSGDSQQAARKLEFSIAYNTPDKDKTFVPLNLKIGGFIYLFYREKDTNPEIEIFQGRIFYRKRVNDSNTFEYSCFDDMIYLAKSNIRAIITGTVAAGIQQVCKEIGIPVGTLPDGLNASVDYIADDKSGTEVLRALFDIQQAADKAVKKDTYYLPVCINGQVNVIKKGELIDGYVATADTNTFSTEHSESIENMVNRIKAVDDNGTICQMFTINDDVTHYGMIQKIYKMQPPKPGETVDNVTAAKAKLARLKDESSMKGIGNVQCITGYSIKVQEEQLTGTFYIKGDTHNFENSVHTMDLTLEYIPNQPEQPEIEQVDYATPVFNSSKERMKNKEGVSNGSANVDSGIAAGWDVWGGQTMANGREGCAEFVGKCGSYYSPFLAGEAKKGIVNCPTMVSDAESVGLLSYDMGNLQKGDVLVYGNDDHVVIYDGQGGYYGNSSSRNVTVHGDDYTQMGGMKVTKVIKASKG